jgi:hypothetical protein
MTMSLVVLCVIGCGNPVSTASSTNPAPRGPSASDFEILNWKVIRSEYGTPRVVGEVRNNGSAAAGVELQIIVRDARGDVMGSEDFWPASVDNIPPSGTWPVSYHLPVSSGYSKVELRVIGASVW